MGRSALKVCNICNTEKPISAFYKHSRYSKRRPWFRGNCKTCHSTLGKDSYIKNKLWWDGRIRGEHLSRCYGMTISDWDKLFTKQGGQCAACHKPEIKFNNKSRTIQRLCVDHNHKTGKVRGLLCNRCNRVIGLLEEDLILVKSLYDYFLQAEVH